MKIFKKKNLSGIFKNSVLLESSKLIGDLEEFISKVLIRFSFHSKRLSCHKPRQIVKTIQNNVNTKNL